MLVKGKLRGCTKMHVINLCRRYKKIHPLGLSNQAEKYLFTSQFTLFSASLGGGGGVLVLVVVWGGAY